MQRIDGKLVTAKFDAELLAKIDSLAEKTGNTRSETVRNLCDVGCYIAGFYSALGIFDLHQIVQKSKKKIQNGINPKLIEEA